MAEDRIRNLQLQALRAVIKPDGDAQFRHICRWFSETFCTPLMDVYDLPMEFVYQHYYERFFEDRSPQERVEHYVDIMESPEQKLERIRKEEMLLTEQLAAVTGIKKPIQKVEEESAKKEPSALEKQLQQILGNFKPKIKKVKPSNPKVQALESQQEEDGLKVPVSTKPKPQEEEDPLRDFDLKAAEPVPLRTDEPDVEPLEEHDPFEFTIGEGMDLPDFDSMGPKTKK